MKRLVGNSGRRTVVTKLKDTFMNAPMQRSEMKPNVSTLDLEDI